MAKDSNGGEKTALLSGRADLHTHSTASDGMQTPAENVRLARSIGLGALAVTDHDTVAGVAEAMREGEALGVTVIPGVEISTRAGGKDIHVLGYYVDDRDPLLLERLSGLRNTRDARNEAITAKLRNLGIGITMDAVIGGMGRPLKQGESVGRPHIADELVRLGAASDMREAFDRYLAEGAAAFVLPPRIPPEEACRWIAEAGGAAVLAHPGLYGDDALVRTILEQGIFAGLEVYHSDHDQDASGRYKALAEELGLIATGGSDFHGERGGAVFHGNLGSVTAGMERAVQLRKAAGK